MTFPASPYLVAMGDSMTLGREDPGPSGTGWLGWVPRLAGRLGIPADRVVNTAAEGATAAHVADIQLPLLSGLAPHVIAFSCGMNDVIRGYHPDDFTRALETILGWASGAGTLTLTTALLPPCWSKLRVSRIRRARLERDVLHLNEQLRHLAAAHDTACLDPAELPDARSPAMWADDGVHLSARGHAALAKAMASLARPRMPLDIAWGLKLGLGWPESA